MSKKSDIIHVKPDLTRKSFVKVRIMNGDEQFINLDHVVRFGVRIDIDNNSNRTYVPSLELSTREWIPIHSENKHTSKTTCFVDLDELIAEIMSDLNGP